MLMLLPLSGDLDIYAELALSDMLSSTRGDIMAEVGTVKRLGDGDLSS